MRELPAFKVDAFTTTLYAGNIAGVVLDADGLTEREMRSIAREFNVSETAFVLPPSAPGADLRLRYFTPTHEIGLCGHATVAAGHVLVESGRLRGPATLRVETQVGVLPLELREGGEVFLTSDPLVFAPSPVDADEAARLLGCARGDIADALPMALVRGMLFVPLTGLKAMGALKPDLPAIARLHSERGVDGVVALSLETMDASARTHIRYFVPGVGIDEDPVTGSAHMSLGGYLARAGRLDLSSGAARFVGEQGHFMGRPGNVTVEVEGAPDAMSVRAGGTAVTTLRGTLRVA